MLSRCIIIVLALAMNHSAAQADCESAADKARENILTSGPFHYTSHQWNKNFDRHRTGTIEPNKAEHIAVEWSQDGQRISEQIYIGTQSWKNDGFGWLPPLGSSWSHQFTVPDASYQALKTKCLGQVVIEAKALIGYELETRFILYTPPPAEVFLEKIFVDPDTGLTVRYERSGGTPEAINVVSTYRYDPSIRIEPPQVDLASRKAKSLQAFQLAVDSADVECRKEVLRTIDHGQTALPFQYKIVGQFWNGVSGMYGTFVAPNSTHNTIDGVPYHGGGLETITIGNRSWQRLAEREWVETSNPSPMAGAVSASWSSPFFLPAYLNGRTYHVGRAACLGETEKDHGRYRLFEYDAYVDFETSRNLASKRRMYVDTETRLPLRFEDLDYKGQVIRLETRTYDKDIAIEPPTVAPPSPGHSSP